MKWISHKLVSGSLVFMATGDVPCTIAAMLGSIFPDLIEGRPETDGWRSRHRRNSHWFVPYAVVAAIMFVQVWSVGVVTFRGAGIMEIFSLLQGSHTAFYGLCAFFAVGALCHIGEDAICGRVPSFNPKKRIGARFFKVGSAAEYMISLTTACMCLFLRLG